jgi:hypothetical protein
MTRSRDQCDAELPGERQVAPAEAPDSPWELGDADPFEADPWDAIEEVPQWDPLPAAEPESARFDDSWEEPGVRDESGGERPGAPGRLVGTDPEGVGIAAAASRSFAVRRTWPIQLIRSHPFALVVAVCFVAAALLALSNRPSGQARSNRPASADRASRTKAQAAAPGPGGKRKRHSRRRLLGAALAPLPLAAVCAAALVGFADGLRLALLATAAASAVAATRLRFSARAALGVLLVGALLALRGWGPGFDRRPAPAPGHLGHTHAHGAKR